MSKNLKLVLFFTVVVAVAVTGYLYNENKNAVSTLENMPSVEANVTDNVVPAVGEAPTEVVATPEIKAAVVTLATEIKTEAVPVTTQAINTKNKK